MKRNKLIFTIVSFFAFAIAAAFSQGSLSGVTSMPNSELGQVAPFAFEGLAGTLANLVATLLNTLMNVSGGSLMIATILMAFAVEMILLYPSVRIQMKQKKIHLFHKKLVDRFKKGELKLSAAKTELGKLYSVNETIHSRGALLVASQIILFLAVLWGLNLIVQNPVLLKGGWNVLSFSLMGKPSTFALPLIASLLYFTHSLIKISVKEREDYISRPQSVTAIAIALVASTAVYYFAHQFATLLSLYFVTQVAFATLRYVIVEEHSKDWGKLAQRELIRDLKDATSHRNGFEYFSRQWNHLPIVRHLNFHLLEEALSMTLGLILALNFFGIFGNESRISASPIGFIPKAMAAQSCVTPSNPGFCEFTNSLDTAPVVDSWGSTAYWADCAGTGCNIEEFVPAIGAYIRTNPLPSQFPPVSCCIEDTQFVLYGTKSDSCADAVYAHADGADPTEDSICNPADDDCIDGRTTTPVYACFYMDDVEPVKFGTCPATIINGQTYAFTANGGTGDRQGSSYYTYSFQTSSLAGSTIDPVTGSYKASTTAIGSETVQVTDAQNSSNSATCTFQVTQAPNNCKEDFTLRTHFGNVLKIKPGDVSLDVYGNTKYRFYLDNTISANQIGYYLKTNTNQMVTSVRQEANFVEMSIEPGKTSGNQAQLVLWDPQVESSGVDSSGNLQPNVNACRFVLNLNWKGEGVKKLTPNNVHISF